MDTEKQLKIDIPESIDRYKVTLFWGLTVTQVILVFIGTLFTGFAIFSVVSGHTLAMLGLLIVAALAFIGLVEIRGRNFYHHGLFILTYYKSKPRVLIYNHYASSGIATIQKKQLVYQKENNTKIFIMIAVALVIGLTLLLFIALYLYHVTHT